MANRKDWIILGICFSAIITLSYTFTYIIFIDSKTTCGRITRETFGSKGGHSTHYIFFVGSEKIEGNTSNSFLKKIPLDSLKKIECIEIEYSRYSTIFNRLIDKRIVK
jgi:hypothetical protein